MNTDSPESHSELWSRRRWIRQFMLGSAVALGAGRAVQSTLLAELSPFIPKSDILPISFSNFPGFLTGETPSLQLLLSVFDEAIMINKAPYNDYIYVLNSRCTHQGCLVNKWDLFQNIECPCHGSIFGIDGSLISGAEGPQQPPLQSYAFDYDGVDLLRIYIPGLNLNINGITAENITPSNKRLRLSFPGRAGCEYGVRYSPDLNAAPQPALFAITANGPANQTSLVTYTDTPLNVWVDNAGPRGFYRIELILPEL